MIMKKTAKNFGATGAHIILPKALVNKEVYVVADEAMRELEELVTITLLYRKAQSFEQSELKRELANFTAKTELRLKRLEDIIVIQ